jgi:hypothetical protein
VQRAIYWTLGLFMICGWAGRTLADEFHGINAGAPIWDGVIQFTKEKAAAIAATGCRAVRINFRLDGHGSWDADLLSQYDTVIQHARNNHLVVLGLICNEARPVGQAHYNDDPDGDGLNAYVHDFAATALLLVDRYKSDIKRWEIWNEPGAWTNPNWANDPRNAGGTYILPAVYANLLAETYKQLNHYNGRTILTTHGIKLVSGGLFAHDIGGSFSTGMDYMLRVYDQTAVWDALEAATGRRYPWDYFGYHFYLNAGEPVSTQEIGDYLNDVRTGQAARGDHSPLLITEFGWTTAGPSESLQRDNMRETYTFLESRPFIAGTYWYQWQDESPTVKYGLLRADGTLKPAYDEFVLRNMTSPRRIPGDMDQDGDVDQVDFGLFQACFSGFAYPQNDPACANAKLDGDHDVDADDLKIFRRCMSGANVPADPDCA